METVLANLASTRFGVVMLTVWALYQLGLAKSDYQWGWMIIGFSGAFLVFRCYQDMMGKGKYKKKDAE